MKKASRNYSHESWYPTLVTLPARCQHQYRYSRFLTNVSKMSLVTRKKSQSSALVAVRKSSTEPEKSRYAAVWQLHTSFKPNTDDWFYWPMLWADISGEFSGWKCNHFWILLADENRAVKSANKNWCYVILKLADFCRRIKSPDKLGQ